MFTTKPQPGMNFSFLCKELENLGAKIQVSSNHMILADFSEKTAYLKERFRTQFIPIRKFNILKFENTDLEIVKDAGCNYEILLRILRRFLAEYRGWSEIQKNPSSKARKSFEIGNLWRH